MQRSPLTYVDADGRPLPDRNAAARRVLESSIVRREHPRYKSRRLPLRKS